MGEQPAPPELATETAVEEEFEGMEVDAPRVGIVMGSKSDMPAMEAAAKELESRDIHHEVRVMSAHRDPETVADYAKNAKMRGLRVIIAGAGLAAALPGVVAAHERDLQCLSTDRQARDVEGVADLLRRLGPLDETALRRRTRSPDDVPTWLEALTRQRRVIRVRIAARDCWAAVEDAGRLRDALGVALPVGVAEAFTEPVDDPLG